MRRFVTTALIGSLGVAYALAGVGAVSAQDERLHTVVTLGDSYSSGVGIHDDASDYDDHGPERHSFDADTRLGHSACHREVDTTPGPRLAAAFGAQSLFTACAGAEIDEIANQVAATNIDGSGAGTVVTMTIGGNDVRTERGEGWPEVLLRCVLETNCHESDQNQVANLAQIQSDLIAEYEAIGEEYPDLTVRVLGYPRLMQPDRWGCIGMSGVGGDEANWVDDRVDALNLRINIATIVARIRTGADIRFVDVEDDFDNHGACRVWQRDRHVNDSRIGETYKRVLDEDGNVVHVYEDNWIHLSSSSVHPTQDGYDAYYDALVESLPSSASIGSD